MTSTARALWIVAPGRAELRGEPVPDTGGVLVRADYSGISRGTEALVFAGGVPASEHHRMRAPFQAGDFPFPVKYGYASVGRVERGPAALVDRSVFVLYPHQDRYVVPADAVHLVPDGVPAARAVLAANMETAINAIWDAGLEPAQEVLVVGAGVVGCLTGWAARHVANCRVTIADVNPAREPIAARLGLQFVPPDALRAQAEVVFHASATAQGLAIALAAAAFEGMVVEMSWFGDRQVPVPLGADFHARRLTLKSSQVGHVSPRVRATMSHGQRLDYALSLLGDPALDVLISGETRFEDLPAMLPTILGPGSDALCQRVRY